MLAEARLLLAGGRYPEALACLQALPEATRRRVEGLRLQAEIHQLMGRRDNALEDLAAAVQTAPTDMGLALEYAFLAQECGDRTAALRTFAALGAHADAAIREKAENARQEIMIPLNAEISRWEAVLRQHPDDVFTRHELAGLYRTIGREQEALAHLNILWQTHRDPALLLETAELHLRLGRPAEARAELAAVLSCDRPRLAAAAEEMVREYGIELNGEDDRAALALLPPAHPTPPPSSSPAEERASWPLLLAAAGFAPTGGALPGIRLPYTAGAAPVQANGPSAQGGLVIVEGDGAEAAHFGFRPTNRPSVLVRAIRDVHAPEETIVWERPSSVPWFNLPPQARVFARDRRSGAPLLAGFRQGQGAVLWSALPPGRAGYERFPYLAQALLDLGRRPLVRARRLWAFLDTSYRRAADVDYLAEQWRRSGIAALHVAAWHFFEPRPADDAYLRGVIAACHSRGIRVYAWLELPHVSEEFWQEHPSWREKTAVGQDAFLDWRKLMNLQNRDCFRAAARGVERLLQRFDWDGVNLAELYFESLEGAANPARFTPLNNDVRRRFAARPGGFDPLELFRPDSPRYREKDPAGLRAFLDFRRTLAREMQEEWLAELQRLRRSRPLDLVLTHVDDRFDPRMKDLIAADAAAVIRQLERIDMTFLVEDPAPLWNLGPSRYPLIAEKYRPLTRRRERLAVDINVVERGYGDVYPTLRQTGMELLQLVHLAARSFARVTLYSESTVHPVDLDLLPAAAAAADFRLEPDGALRVSSAQGVEVYFPQPARVDGRWWPVCDGDYVMVPPGRHIVEAAEYPPTMRIVDLNADLLAAAASANGFTLEYRSSGRGFAVLNARPARLLVDGRPLSRSPQEGPSGWVVPLPAGRHRLTALGH